MLKSEAARGLRNRGGGLWGTSLVRLPRGPMLSNSSGGVFSIRKNISTLRHYLLILDRMIFSYELLYFFLRVKCTLWFNWIYYLHHEEFCVLSLILNSLPAGKRRFVALIALLPLTSNEMLCSTSINSTCKAQGHENMVYRLLANSVRNYSSSEQSNVLDLTKPH